MVAVALVDGGVVKFLTRFYEFCCERKPKQARTAMRKQKKVKNKTLCVEQCPKHSDGAMASLEEDMKGGD